MPIEWGLESVKWKLRQIIVGEMNKFPQWLMLKFPQWLMLKFPQWLMLKFPQWLMLPLKKNSMIISLNNPHATINKQKHYFSILQ